MRTNNGKATLINKHLCSFLEELNIDIIRNKNVVSWHLEGKRLHLKSGCSKPIGVDRKSRGGGIMLLIRKNIPFRMLKRKLMASNTEPSLLK